MGIVLFAISAVVMIIGLVFSILKSKEVITNTITKINFKDYFIKNGIYGGVFTLGMLFMFLSIYLWAGLNPNALEIVQTIFGSLGFGILGYISLHSFLLHYYGKKIPDNLNKWLFRALMIAFPIMFLFVFLLSNGFADYLNLNEPLYNGLNFSVGFVRPSYYSGYKTNLAFYALCILSGAIYTYLYSDHKMYIEYGKHGILESTFLVAFPAGIIGARVGYVIGEWPKFNGDFLKMINMTDGGLTVLSGAITGIVVGVLWFMWRNKKYSVLVAADIVVPAILIAQAVGRWGNFFNCEVHGLEVSEEYFRWLPKVIFNNMHFSDSVGTSSVGTLYLPLFFIEGVINFFGFFLIAHVFGKALRKYTELGDLTFAYVGWYGLTRILLEPLRDPSYKMGEKGYWSWIWSFIFVVVAALLIVGNHLFRYFLKKKKGELHIKKNWFKVGLIGSISIVVISLAMLIPGIVLMSTADAVVTEPVFNSFHVGLMLIVLGSALFLGLGISLPRLIEGKKYQNVEQV